MEIQALCAIFRYGERELFNQQNRRAGCPCKKRQDIESVVYCASLTLGSLKTHRTLTLIYLDSLQSEQTEMLNAAANGKEGDWRRLSTLCGATGDI